MPLEAAFDKALKESRPERFGLGRAEPQYENLVPAIVCNHQRDYCRGRDDEATITHLEVGRIEPDRATRR
jgi:hypothetical protein